MGYINKSYLQKQLENLAARISAVFAKSTDIPTKTSQLENDSDYVDNSMVGVSKDDEGITNIEYTLYSVEAGGKAKLNGETSLRDAVANSTSYIATNMQKLDEKIPTAVEPVNNLLATVAGSPLDAVQGKVLDDKIEAVNASLKTVKTYVDEDGKLHFVDSEGADTALNFSSIPTILVNNNSETNNTLETGTHTYSHTATTDEVINVVFVLNYTNIGYAIISIDELEVIDTTKKGTYKYTLYLKEGQILTIGYSSSKQSTVSIYSVN